jgi:hypothetical protein
MVLGFTTPTRAIRIYFWYNANMSERLTTATAIELFRQWKFWFGSPLIRFNGIVYDGRIRLTALQALGGVESTVLQAHVVRTHSELAKMLCVAGHYDRAREHVPDALLSNVHDVAAYCGSSIELVAPMLIKGRPPRMKARTTVARRRAIEAMARAIREGENSTGYVTCNRLRELFSQWL